MSINSRPLGVSLSASKHLSLAETRTLAALADRLGYHSLWIPETWGWDAISVLAMACGATSRISIASGVLNVYSRSPTLIAQTAATLQELSNGRFILGLGASGPTVVEHWHGVPFSRPLERTRAYISIIRAALSGEEVAYEGEGMDLRGFRLSNPPSTPVPIYLAALGPRNVRLAGEVADGWLPIFAPLGHLRPLLETFHDSACQAGRNPDSLTVAAYLPAAIAPCGERLLAQQLAYYIGGMGSFYGRYISRLGFERDAALIRDHWQAGDRLSAVNAVSRGLLDCCTLGTTTEAARERLDAFRAEGVMLPIVTLPRGCNLQEIADTLEVLAPRDA
ncbi:MAG: LLM class flavin-dependent oxidoreductase [Chloroflexota bacterium]